MAVVGTITADSPKDLEALKPNATRPSPRFLRHLRRLKRPASTEAPIKGQLRMKSSSGAFVIFGIFVVLVGMTIAVIGYWPQRTTNIVESSEPRNASRSSEARSSPTVQARSPASTEKLKLIGPVIMGVGLFIFICANTMLYENRDLETRLLLQKNLYSMAISLPCDTSADLKYCERKTEPSELQSKPEECFHEIDLPSCILQPCSNIENKWAECCNSHGLQTTALLLHHNGVSPSISLRSVYSDSSNSAQGSMTLTAVRETTESQTSSTENMVSVPVIKVNNYIIDNSDIAKLSNKGEMGNSKSIEHSSGHSWNILNSLSDLSKDEDLDGSHVVIKVDNVASSNHVEKGFLSPEYARREFSSDMQLNNVGHSKSVRLSRRGARLVAMPQERRNRSWPRLDRINLIGYNKLENRDSLVDKSLEKSDPLISRGPRMQDTSGDMV